MNDNKKTDIFDLDIQVSASNPNEVQPMTGGTSEQCYGSWGCNGDSLSTCNTNYPCPC